MASSPTRQRVDLNAVGVRRCVSQKVGYGTYDDALTACERMMDAGKVKPGCHMTPYECDECSEWHVGNKVIVTVPRSQRAQV